MCCQWFVCAWRACLFGIVTAAAAVVVLCVHWLYGLPLAKSISYYYFIVSISRWTIPLLCALWFRWSCDRPLTLFCRPLVACDTNSGCRLDVSLGKHFICCSRSNRTKCVILLWPFRRRTSTSTIWHVDENNFIYESSHLVCGLFLCSSFVAEENECTDSVERSAATV